ncbi:MAG TPA: addiction module toxin, HicA family [Proteobacteria bacterium]|nr:addiction module toxin, HicA family [Pseudomonadota bacterium]
MSKLKLIDAQTMEKLLFLLGFKRIRQKGSHVFYGHPDGRTTTIPHHKGRVLARPLIREILREIEVAVDEYAEYLEKL